MSDLRTAWIFMALGSTGVLSAQVDSSALRYGQSISQVDLRAYLDTLANDAFEGRETAMPGQKKAASFLREKFIGFGIPSIPDAAQRGLLNGYEQPFPLEVLTPGSMSISLNEKPIRFMEDFFYFSEPLRGELAVGAIAFVGFADSGADWTEAGPVALVLQPPDTGAQKGKVPVGNFVLHLLDSLAAQSAQSGVRLLFYGSEHAQAMMELYGGYITGPRMTLTGTSEGTPEPRRAQVVVIDPKTADAILRHGRLTWKKAYKRAKRIPVAIHCTVVARNVPDLRELQGENVLGYIEGGGKKEELIVVSAHYDHLGTSQGQIYNGADDDGSGTAAVLELAQAFALAKRDGQGPTRSILFLAFSGEEKGLLGSEWYGEHPVFPMKNTVACLNMDMIGRVDTTHFAHERYVYVIGSDRLSTELHRINERMNETYTHLDLDYTYNAADDPNRFYYRSDHYNFAQYGVPIIFFFNGDHEDYHQPTDDVWKIRFDLLEQRARLVFHVAWELANREERLVVDKPLPDE
ncbi:MAG: M28 family peptidase [Flavobacteriales bacterium]